MVAMKEPAAYLHLFVRKPALITHWLMGARAAMAVLILSVMLLPLVFLPIADRLLGYIYQPVESEALFGIIKQKTDDPRLDERKAQARFLLWGSSGTAFLIMLWLNIPAALKQAEALARRQEKEADAMAGHRPERGLELYESALSIVTDTGHEEALMAKIDALRGSVSLPDAAKGAGIAGGKGIKLKGNPSEATMVQTAGKDASGKASVLERRIGPGGRYRIIGQAGRGAMGIVHRAVDDVLQREVAVKELPGSLAGDEALLARFRHEARVLARLSHPGIVRVYDFFEDEGTSAITMEFIQGEDLQEILERTGIIDIKKVISMGMEMADTMAYAHGEGVVHRDFKPANVIVAGSGRVKITDFGLARLAHSSIHTQAGTLMGSPAYMRPEQAEGKAADASTDIYAFGIMLYRMCTGRVPFEADDAGAVLACHLTQKPSPPSKLNPDIPEKLARLIEDMLEKKPKDRPRDMKAVARRLSKSL